MTMPSDKQIRKFWEWCGVFPEKDYSELPGYILRYPNIDLNNLFKYAVPKAGHVKLEHVICIDPMAFPKKNYQKPYDFIPEHYYDKETPRYHWYRADILWKDEHLTGEAETPALALCIAINKRIEQEVDSNKEIS